MIGDGFETVAGDLLWLTGALAAAGAFALAGGAVVAVAAALWDGPIARAGWRVKAYRLARRWRS